MGLYVYLREGNGIVKDNKKHFHRSISNKRKTEENIALVLYGAGDLMTRGVGKAEALPDFFASCFFVKTCLQESQVSEISGKVWSNADLHLSKGRCSQGKFKPVDIHKPMGPDGMYPQMLRSWPMPLQSQLNYLWKVMAIGEGQEESECQEVQEGLGNYRTGKMMEQIFLGTISKDTKDKKMAWNSQYKLSKGKSCLTNLIAFCNWIICSVNEEWSVDGFILALARLLTLCLITSLLTNWWNMK